MTPDRLVRIALRAICAICGAYVVTAAILLIVVNLNR